MMGPRSLILTIFGVVAAALLAVSFFVLWQAYAETRERIHTQALASAHVVAAHVRWIVGTSRQALQQVDRLAGPAPAELSEEAQEAIRRVIAAIPANVGAWVIDRNGVPRFSTGGDDLNVTVEGRPFYEALKSGEQNFHVSSLIVGRSSKMQMFVIARRFERNGEFAGVATISVPAAMMSEFLQQLALGEGSTVSVFRTDGWLVARYPPSDGPMNLINYVLFTEHLPKNGAGTYDAVSPADGVNRVVGYVRLDDEGLVGLASIAADYHLRPFWYQLQWVVTTLAVILLMFGILMYWLVNVLRREDRSRAELAKAFEQNKLLFQEIHHRVKNNLQAVSALIQLQPLSPEAKSQMAHRLTAMAAIHEQSYRSEQYGDLLLSDYLSQLATNLQNAYGNRIAVKTELEPVVIERDKALPLGLVANEVLSNALKHAFPDQRRGEVRMRLLARGENLAELEISDDGVGMQEPKSHKGLGSRLIRAFVTQLGGQASTVVNNGTTFVLRFPTGARNAAP